MTESNLDEEANQARQHRISRRRGEKRARDPLDDDQSEDGTQRTIPLSAIKGIKKQARYEPVIPMSKTELSKWRKEARRVRNRESAAASRRKTRDRIDELESQVKELEAKYGAALKRIAELETGTNGTTVTPIPSPLLAPQPATTIPSWSLSHQQAANMLAQSTPGLEMEMLPNTLSSPPSPVPLANTPPMPNLMIPRPTAVLCS